MCEEKKSELDRLIEDYPDLYGDTMCGVYPPEGWVPRIRKLTEDIIKHLGDYTSEDFRVDQVKEKFGGLRYYVGGDRSEEVSDLIDQAEQDCFKLCQVCGDSGKTAETCYYLVTLCPSHMEEREKKITEHLEKER